MDWLPYPVSYIVHQFALYWQTHNNISSIHTSLNQQESCTRDKPRLNTKFTCWFLVTEVIRIAKCQLFKDNKVLISEQNNENTTMYLLFLCMLLMYFKQHISLYLQRCSFILQHLSLLKEFTIRIHIISHRRKNKYCNIEGKVYIVSNVMLLICAV